MARPIAASAAATVKINITNTSKDNFFKTKYILRKAMKDIVPDLIMNRIDKIGYPSPVASWLQNKYNKLLVGLNNENDLPQKIRYFFSNVYSSTRGEYDRTRWQFLQFSIWYMIFIEKRSINDINNYLKLRSCVKK